MGGCVRHRINRWLGGKIAAGWEGCEMGWGVGGVDYIDGGVIGGMVVDGAVLEGWWGVGGGGVERGDGWTCRML